MSYTWYHKSIELKHYVIFQIYFKKQLLIETCVLLNRRPRCEIFHWIFHPTTSRICIGIFNKEKIF